MENILVVTTEELSALIRKVIRDEFSQLKIDVPKPSDDDFLEIDEARKLLHVSRPTIFSYRKKGILPFHRIGRRVLYKRTEVLDALKKVHQKYD